MSLTVRGPGVSSAGLRASEDAYARGISRISSGFRITRAADDAAGLAISQRMRSQVNGSTMAMRNVQDGINMLQTAEGGLSGMTAMLQRARELAVQAASTGTMTGEDRAAAAAEVRQLVGEIDRTARTTSFNGHRMLDGSRLGGFVFQVGANGGDVLDVGAYDLTAGALKLYGGTLTTTTLQASGPTTYETTSAKIKSYDMTSTNNEFIFSLNDGPQTVLRMDPRNYGTDLTRLRDDLQEALSEASPPVAVTVGLELTGNGGRFTFTANAGSTTKVTVTGANDFKITTTETTAMLTSTTTASVASLADLVAAGSADAILLSDDALSTVIGARTQLGATQNRMEHQLSALATTGDNLDEARSRIEDADIAKEYAGLVRAQVLTQAGMAMQAQGAQSGQRVLQLLGSL